MSQILTVTVPDLGTEFLLGTETPQKITLAVDGTTIKKDPATGALSVDASVLMTATDSSLSGDGTAANPLSVAYSSDANNGASAGSDGGVFADKLVSGALNAAGDTLTFTMSSGDTVDVDATALTADVRLTAGTYNATTQALDLTVTDGTTTSTVSIPVAALLPVTSDATLSGDGAATPLGVSFSADTGNQAQAGSDGGVFVPPAAAVTNTLVNDGTNTLTSTVGGVVDAADIVNTNTLAAGTAAGTIVSTVNGVASAEFAVKDASDLTLCNAFGTAIASAFSV